VRAGLALSLAVALAVALGLVRMLDASRDPVLLPLDDTYIHFQYARQWAAGEPLVYSPGDPATSGETSLLYAPLLALGYTLGFTGWTLAAWALALGALSLWGSALLVYRIGLLGLDPGAPVRPGYALALAVAFAVAGPFLWAALSGMETLPFVFAVLLTLFAVGRGRLRLAVLGAVLLAALRPEGTLLAALAALALALRPWPRGVRARAGRVAWLALPLIAAALQPLVNLLATGSAASSGLQAKSHLTNVGADWPARIEAVVRSFARIWQELLVGRSPDFGTFTSLLLAPLALAGLLAGTYLALKRRRVNAALLGLVWALALTAAVSTLDTAFWQFKRYQLPVMALFFPATAWTCAAVGERLAAALGRGWVRAALPALILLPSVLTALTFARDLGVNVGVVRDQQLPMARWVRTHLPEEARIGAHDVGLLAYFGERPLYDVVGLTTRGAARAWRQGPGAVYEQMASSDQRPDFFAIYPDVQGLRMLLDAGVFGDVLAEFPLELPAHNVAAAAGYQAVYAADWSGTRAEEIAAQRSVLDALAGFELVDQLDVADLDSEAAHEYEWWQDATPPGFVSEVYRHPYMDCGLPDEADCWATDGGRVLTGGEAFTLRTTPGEDLLLVTRVHGRTSAALTIYADGREVARRVQPGVPGRWTEIPTLIPAAQVAGDRTRIRIEVETADPAATYLPYYHWAYQGAFAPEAPDEEPRATFGAAGEVRLAAANARLDAGTVAVTLRWIGPAPGSGDGVVFVHLYNTSETDAPPLAQAVARPGGGALPPANWLPRAVEDRYELVLPRGLPADRYAVAIGLFEAATGARYPAAGEGATADGRLFIGEFSLEESVP